MLFRSYKVRNIPAVIVENSRKALSEISAVFSQHPSKKLITVGITGTNGKTTIHWILDQAFTALDLPSIKIGTLGYSFLNDSHVTGLTTPDAASIQELLARALSKGAKAAVLEASSHALEQERVSGLHFDVAIFTNLTRDHLDFHLTEENYREAKWKLFELLLQSEKKHKIAVVNLDSPTGIIFADRLKARAEVDLYTYGRSENCRIQIVNQTDSFLGSVLELSFENKKIVLSSPYVGDHNAENVAAAVATIIGLGLPLSKVIQAIENFSPVPGRLEKIPLSNDFGAFVDYAHTPDALERVVKSLKPLTSGKLKVVFGCGGDRDKGKRPIMLQAALRDSDLVWVTSDNPRTENPDAIVKEILVGVDPKDLDRINVTVDRRAAINEALQTMSKGDVLLIAGKGHEDYQIIGTKKYPFSDQFVLREEFDLIQSGSIRVAESKI